LGTELSYVDSPLSAGAPPLEETVVPAYLASQAGTVPLVDATRTAQEVEVTPDIAGKAQELGCDPVALYELVKNEFGLDLYFGVLKGAADTFRQRRGGPADLAAVLIALLRACELPARYVTGTIRLDRARLVSLVGVDDDPQLLQLSIRQVSGGSTRPPMPDK
jgi:hypothetical protein